MKRTFSIFLLLVLAASCFSLIACNKVADNTEYYDSITKTLKLPSHTTANRFYPTE